MPALLFIRILLVFFISGSALIAQEHAAAPELNPPPAEPATAKPCALEEVNAIQFPIRFPARACIQLSGGFASHPGSFASASVSTHELLHMGEEMRLTAEIGVRTRRAQFSLSKPFLFGRPIETGLTAYAQRFAYNQRRESSIFAFSPDIPLFDRLSSDALLHYTSHSLRVSAFVGFPMGRFSHLRLTYQFDASSVTPLTASTREYFEDISFEGLSAPQSLHAIKTSALIPSYAYSTIDNPGDPGRGMALTAKLSVSGLGGDSRTLEPIVEAKYFRRGFTPRAVIGLRFLGRLITGYGGQAVPPFDRYYMGGENDVRGLDSWSASPIIYIPSVASANVLNADGSQRVQPIIVDGVVHYIFVTQSIPVYRFVSAGGDTNIVANLEYRIHLTRVLNLVFFGDVGVNRITFLDQLHLTHAKIDQLNQHFPSVAFSQQPVVQHRGAGVQVSTGPQLEFRVPHVTAPVRVYWAYNPTASRTIRPAPIPFDRYIFPNNATYEKALNAFPASMPFSERRFLIRFAIGRTF